MLQALLAGTISESDEASLATHLERCPTCRHKLQSLANQGDPSDECFQLLKTPMAITPTLNQVLTTMESSGSKKEASEASHTTSEELPYLEPVDDPAYLGSLGRYLVIKLLGRGGMGVVYQARDPVLGRLVAVKVLAPQLTSHPTARERFVREARAVAAVNHPNVVTIHAIEEADDRLLMVMEFVDGLSLAQLMNQRGSLPIQEVVRIGSQTAAGLAAAHAQGLIHRDIKPANLLLVHSTGQVKIADFGLARAAEDTGLTQTGLLVGTPCYMAPEQARGRPLDHRTDLFSLGSVLYAMCTGHAPYSGKTSMAIVRQVAECLPPPLESVVPGIPPWLASLVRKLHAQEPANRIQSATEVVQCLEHQQALPSWSENSAPLQQPEPATASCPTAMMDATLLANPEATMATRLTEPFPAKMPPAGTPPQALPLPAPPPPPLVRPSRRPFDWKPIQQTLTAGGAVIVALLLLAFLRGTCSRYRDPALPERNPKPYRSAQSPTTTPAITPAPASTATSTVTGPASFAVLGKTGDQRTFATLAQAIDQATSGNTIEIRTNGPIALEPIHLQDKAMVIRAAPGFCPVLCGKSPKTSSVPLIRTEARLVLEGLDLRGGGAALPCLLSSRRATLAIANCRLSHTGAEPMIVLDEPPQCELRNVLLHSAYSPCIDSSGNKRARLGFQNCVFLGPRAVMLHCLRQRMPETEMDLRRNTLLGQEAIRIHFEPPVAGPLAPEPVRVLSLTGVSNYLNMTGPLLTLQADWLTPPEIERLAQDAANGSPRSDDPPASKNTKSGHESSTRGDSHPWRSKALSVRTDGLLSRIKRLIAWRDEHDLYQSPETLLAVASSRNPQLVAPIGALHVADDWNRFWGNSSTGLSWTKDSLVDIDQLRRKGLADPESLEPADFRRCGDRQPGGATSEALRAGAVLAHVGPGNAYHAWKETPDYRQWRQTVRREYKAGEETTTTPPPAAGER